MTSPQKNSQNSSQHAGVFYSDKSFCPITLKIGFPSSPYGFPACLCVTGLTDTPTYDFCTLKSELQKTIPVKSDGYRNVNNVKYNEDFLEIEIGKY